MAQMETISGTAIFSRCTRLVRDKVLNYEIAVFMGMSAGLETRANYVGLKFNKYINRLP